SNALVGDGQNVTGVWDANNMAVWHKKDATTSTTADSTSSGFTGTKQSANNPLEDATAKIGRGQNYDGTGDYIYTSSNANLNPINMTVSTWIKIPAAAGNAQYDRIIEIGGDAQSSGVGIEFTSATAFRVLVWDGASNYQVGDTYTFTADVWTNITVTSQTSPSQSHKFYINGSQVGSTSTSTRRVESERVTFACKNSSLGSNLAKIYIDETRISNSVREDGWRLTEYANQNDPSTFYTVAAASIDSSLTIATGAYQLKLSADLTNAGTGDIIYTGDIVFDGADASEQIITGSATYQDFIASTSANSAGRTLTFAGGSTATVTGTWTITGYSGKVITLQSSDANVWTINPTAASVTYVDVSKSTNTGVDFCATYSTGADTVGWNITATDTCPGIVVSGTFYTNEAKSTNIGAGVNISLTVAGAPKESMLSGDGGTFSFSGIEALANDLIVVYIDGDVTYEGTFATQVIDDVTNVTGIEAYSNKVVLSHQTAGPMTNTILSAADSTFDDDIKYTLTGSNIDFADGFEMWVNASKTYTPGGTVDVDDVDVNGTFTMGANAVAVHGNWDATGGSFTSSGTVTFDGTDAQTITSDGDSFTNVVVSNTHASGVALTDAIDIDGDLTIAAGGASAVLFNAATSAVTVGDDLTMTKAAAGVPSITMGTNTWSVAGDVNLTNGTIDDGTSTLLLNGVANQTITSNSQTFNALTITNASADPGVTFADSSTVADIATVTTPSVTLTFTGGTTHAWHTINLNGQAVGTKVVMQSSDASDWLFNVTTQNTLSYVNVSHSDASGGIEIQATDGTITNGGNNTNWIFSYDIDISGTFYANEAKSADIGSGHNISVSVDGGEKATVLSGMGGTFAFSDVTVYENQMIAIFIDDDMDHEGSLITQAVDASGNISGLEGYTNKVVLRHETAGPISNTLLDTAKPVGEADLHYTITMGAADFDDGFEVWVDNVVSGKTYTPGGTVEADDLEIRSGSTFDPAANGVTLHGSYKNSGTLTTSGLVTFDSTASGKTISGTLTGGSAFYKILFNGTGGAWTIEDAILISAANAADTLTVSAGTVTMGNGDNDDFEVRGKLSIATTANQTATFQTAAVAQGSNILVDINNNAAPANCSNCYVEVGASSGSGQGNFIIQKNSILRLNTDYANSDASIINQSTGHVEIKGSQDDSGTSDGTTNETTLTDSTSSWTVDEHIGKKLRITTGAAWGRIYDITANTATTLTRADNSSSSSTIASVAVISALRKICSNSNTMITASNEGVGRFIHDQSGSTGMLEIIDSVNNDANCANMDSFYLDDDPAAFSILANGDTITISDGFLQGDGYEILDYASLTAQSGEACSSLVGQSRGAYFRANAGSESIIQYAFACNLGRSSTWPDYVRGLTFTGVNGSNSNEGVIIDKSEITKNVMGISYLNATHNSLENSKGITNSAIYENYDSGFSGIFADNHDSYVDHCRIYSNAGTGFDDFGSDSVLSNIHAYGNARGIYSMGGSNMMITNWQAYLNTTGIDLYSGANNVVENSKTFSNSHNITNQDGNSTINGNLIYGGIEGLYTGGGAKHNIFDNTFIANSVGIQDLGSNHYSYLFGNQFDYNSVGYDVSYDSQYNYFVDNNFGTLGANTTDFDMSHSHPVADEQYFYLYNNYLTAATPVSFDIVNDNPFVISRKHNGVAGDTKIWGKYFIRDQDTETPQDETIDKFNYAENLWEDSFTAHGYSVGSGAGSEDTDLDYAIDGTFGGDSNYQNYRILCAASNCVTTPNSWEVYRGGTLLTNRASTGSLYTDTQNDGGSAPNIQFKIDDAGTDYTAGATYTFNAWKADNSINTQKTTTVQVDSSTVTVGSAKEMQFFGASDHLSTLSVASPSYNYDLTVNGTLSGNQNNLTASGSISGGGLVNLSTGSTFIQKVAGASKTFASTSNASDWTFNDLKFENATALDRTVTVNTGGSGEINVNGTMSVGNAADTNTTTLDNNTNDRILDVNSVAITSKGLLSSSSSASFTVAGNWSNGGAFTHNSGGVVFDGADGSTQAFSGDTIFNNFSAATTANSAARTLQFAGSSTNTMVGTLTLTGETGKRITLQSSNSNNWTINPTAASVTYVEVSRSTNTGVGFCATYSINGGYNIDWHLSAGTDCTLYISGTVYTNEAKSANIGAGHNISLTANGAVRETQASGTGGTFSFSNPAIDPNDLIAIFVDDDVDYEANFASQIVDDNTSITNIEMYTNKVVLSHSTPGPMTNLILSNADSTYDDDIKYTITGNDAQFNSAFELWIATAKTYTPGGTVACNDIEIKGSNATFNPAANAATISGNFNINSGGLLSSSGTITLTSSNAQTITSSSQSFHHLTINNNSLAGLTFADGATVAGTFTNNTQDSKITFNGGSTYTFNALSIAGAAGHQITLTSSAPGTAWLFNVTEATPNADFVTVSDSNASGGSLINAKTGGFNGGGNTNWLFAAALIEISPSSTSVGQGNQRHFTAKAYDAQNYQIPTATFVWSVVGGGGTITSTGWFAAGQTIGTFSNTIEASYDSIADYATVVVTYVPTPEPPAPDPTPTPSPTPSPSEDDDGPGGTTPPAGGETTPPATGGETTPPDSGTTPEDKTKETIGEAVKEAAEAAVAAVAEVARESGKVIAEVAVVAGESPTF
ncbi:MAG: hypothetical protein PHW65_02105, partial [Dehalococcoidales bacterium]|nr:hypothetical protein [Dehalococcoidales bacterium]